MEVSDVKKGLRDAKEYVKNKDFNAALDICKGILKIDKNSYLAWVLSAVSFQELGQSDKALAAFNKATELQPDQLTAWQGLASFLEQKRSQSVVSTDEGQSFKEYSEKLVGVYQQLERLLASDPVKHLNILKKQCELFAVIAHVDRCSAVASILLSKQDSETDLFVARVLSPFLTELSHQTLQMLGDSLSREKEDVYCKEQYLLVNLQLKQYGQVLDTALTILDSDPSHIKSSEAVCIAFVEDSNLDIDLDRVEGAINVLSAAQPKNKYALLAKARWLLSKDRPLEAKQLLESLKISREHGILLASAYEQLHHWGKVETLCRSAVVEAQADSTPWKLKLIKSLLEQGGILQLKEAFELLETLSDSSSVRMLKVLYFLRSGKKELCSSLLDDDDPIGPQSILLKAEYLKVTGREEECEELLDQACRDYPQSVDVLLNSAKLLWTKLDSRPKSVAHFLNVIKINRDISEPYVYLADFYSQDRQNPASLQRAIRCLEKAFQLDPHNSKTSMELLDLYLFSRDPQSAVKLLDVVIQTNPRTCRWAWVEKGRLHLKAFRKENRVLEKEKEAAKAVACFQNALGMDSKDSSSWEALGDAYIARGSYSSALKAFQRASELNPESTYSAYQSASVKQVLGEYPEAVAEFEALLIRNPEYVPALKGLADTLLCQAVDYQSNGFTGRLLGCCSRMLDLLVRAAKIQPDLSCLWSMMGHVCLLLRSIPEEDFCDLRVPSELQVKDSPTKKNVMELGPKFYSAALKLLPESAALWHNLALSYESCWIIDGAAKTKTAALTAIKKAITLEPRSSSHWDLLGLITLKPAESQHAFIRALELNPNTPSSAATWTKLGALYLKHENMQLAHECFKQAQNVDPFHVAAWIGQANIAEQLSPAEAMDLFRHTVSIGSGCPAQCEGSPSYAHWVLSTLADSQAKRTAHYRYNIVQMHAVPTAVDGLVRYIALYPEDSCALNILGLLYERQGLLRKAEETLLKGINCLSRDATAANAASRIDKMKANLARVYTTLGRYEEATEVYGSLQESELSSACGIALAHFKANRHPEAYVTYEAALHWLASDDEKRSHLLVAMAMAAFRRDFPDAESAKLLLYESSQLQPPSVYGLLALGALGLLTEDETLTSAAFQELLPYQSEARYVADISSLAAYLHWSSGNALRGRREICRNVHMLPNVADVWALLASYQATVLVQSDRPKGFDGLSVARCAEAALDALRQSDDSAAEQHGSFQPADLSQVIALISFGYLLAGNGPASRTAAARAVHCNPHSAASWSVLLAAVEPSWSQPSSSSQQRISWLKKLIEHIRRYCDVTAYDRLGPWLNNYENFLATLSH